MTVLATLEKRVRSGLSIWEFCEGDEGFYASNNYGKHISCRDVADLRNFYKKMLEYGFAVPSDTVSPAA